MARKIVYSRKVLTEINDIGGWEEEGSLSPVQKDRLMEEIRGRTLVTSPRADIVQISYRDVHPERAYEVTKAMSSLFIRETLATKEDRKSVVSGKSVSVRVDLGGRLIIKKKKKKNTA